MGHGHGKGGAGRSGQRKAEADAGHPHGHGESHHVAEHGHHHAHGHDRAHRHGEEPPHAPGTDAVVAMPHGKSPAAEHRSHAPTQVACFVVTRRLPVGIQPGCNEVVESEPASVVS